MFIGAVQNYAWNWPHTRACSDNAASDKQVTMLAAPDWNALPVWGSRVCSVREQCFD